MIDNELENKK